MANYQRNFITQMLIRADFVRGSVPLGELLPEPLAVLGADYPARKSVPRTKNEVRIEKTPQGPVKDTRSYNYHEHSFANPEQKSGWVVCCEYALTERRSYEDFRSVCDEFMDIMETISALWPAARISRLGMRYINEIKLPDAKYGTGLGADFWKDYVNELLLGGLRFAANDGALARQMNSIELNYGSDRATIKYGIFNAEHPKPNRRREFILDIDTFCPQELAIAAVAPKLEDFHRAACSVFETAVTDKLRAVLRD